MMQNSYDTIYIPELGITLKTLWSAGRSGAYYKISNKLGVKVFSQWQEGKIKLDSIPNDIRGEFIFQSRAERTGVVPKAYQIVQVQQKETKLWFWGIVMDHVQGEELEPDQASVKVNGKKASVSALIRRLDRSLKDAGVEHLDLSECNVLITKNKAYVIDFGSCR